MSTTLAGAPGDCCRQTVHHVGEARGKYETIAGVETYVARPANGSNKRIVLFFADVFGPKYLNSQLIMDFWADNGYLVVALDYFEDDGVVNNPNSTREGAEWDKWLAHHQERARILTPPWVEAIKKDYGSSDSKYVVVGYCFGAPYVMDYLATDWVLAGAFGHPAFLNEAHFQNVKQPLLLSCSEIDHTFPLEARRRAEDILIEKQATYFFHIFSSVKHGFALRGDPSIPVQRWSKEESARSILNWFNHFCDL